MGTEVMLGTPEPEPLRASEWAVAALDADQVGQSLLTVLWLCRGQVLASASSDARGAAEGALDVVEHAIKHHRKVVQFIDGGRNLAEEREHRAAMETKGEAE